MHLTTKLWLLLALLVGAFSGSCLLPTTQCDKDRPCLTGWDCSAAGTCTCAMSICASLCVDLQSDDKHCGVCGNDCTMMAGKTCKKGICCAKNESPCGLPGNQSCVDFLSDSTHCGKCDNPCPAGQSCSEGSCK